MAILLADVEVLFMEPRNVRNLIKEKSTSFLIMDLRSSEDYKASHIRLEKRWLLSKKSLAVKLISTGGLGYYPGF